MPQHLVIRKGTELHRFPLDALICVSADGNYSLFVTQDGRETLICLQLGQVEEMMHDQLGPSGDRYIRIGRGVIINIDYLHHIDISKQKLVMSDCKALRKEFSASRDALIKLKDYVEQTINGQMK